MITDEERRTIDEFKVGVSLIQTGPDGFPLRGQQQELDIVADLALKVYVLLKRRDDRNAEIESLLSLTTTTSRLIAETDGENRDPATAEEWFKARAELVEPAA